MTDEFDDVLSVLSPEEAVEVRAALLAQLQKIQGQRKAKKQEEAPAPEQHPDGFPADTFRPKKNYTAKRTK